MTRSDSGASSAGDGGVGALMLRDANLCADVVAPRAELEAAHIIAP